MIDATAIKVCDACDGYGIVSNQSVLAGVQLNTLIRGSKKGGGGMTVTQAQEHLNTLQAMASRDTTIHTLCTKCGGFGKQSQ